MFCQVPRCYLRKFAKEVREAGGFMPARPVETEKTASFSSGKMKRLASCTCTQSNVIFMVTNEKLSLSLKKRLIQVLCLNIFLFRRCLMPGFWPEKQRTTLRDLPSTGMSTVAGKKSSCSSSCSLIKSFVFDRVII